MSRTALAGQSYAGRRGQAQAPRIVVDPAPGPGAVLDAWRGHWYRAYSDADFAALQRTIWSRGYPRRRMEVVSLWAGDELLAGAKLYRFPFVLGGRKVEVGGVGAVIVPKPLRGRGYGSELVRRLGARVRSLGLAASVLHSDIDPAYYRRLGYRSVANPEHRAQAGSLVKGPAARGVVEGTKEDLPFVLAAYRESLGARTFGMRPDASYLAFKVAIFGMFHEGPGLRGHRELLVSRRRRAFVLSRRHGKELDLALWGGPEEAVHGLVRELVAGDVAPGKLETVRFTGPRAADLHALFPGAKVRKDYSTMIAWPGGEAIPFDTAGAAAWSMEGF